MKLEGAVVVITGGGAGIGEALVGAAVRERAAAVFVYDRDAAAAEATAKKHEGHGTVLVAASGDVSSQTAIEALVALAEGRFGRIDLFCSNAGIMIEGGVEVPQAEWDRSWSTNVMAHVHAARAALPGMLRRGSGSFLNVSSAAGMLIAPGAAPYTVTKHAALGFAEWLAVAYGNQGIKVSVLCPEAVRTGMLAMSLANGNEGVRRIAESGTILDAATVAKAAVEALLNDRFLVTTHPDTLQNTQKKWSNVDRWIEGMSRFLQMATKV